MKLPCASKQTEDNTNKNNKTCMISMIIKLIQVSMIILTMPQCTFMISNYYVPKKEGYCYRNNINQKEHLGIFLKKCQQSTIQMKVN